jgi:hypothetical protein
LLGSSSLPAKTNLSTIKKRKDIMFK